MADLAMADLAEAMPALEEAMKVSSTYEICGQTVGCVHKHVMTQWTTHIAHLTPFTPHSPTWMGTCESSSHYALYFIYCFIVLSFSITNDLYINSDLRYFRLSMHCFRRDAKELEQIQK